MWWAVHHRDHEGNLLRDFRRSEFDECYSITNFIEVGFVHQLPHQHDTAATRLVDQLFGRWVSYIFVIESSTFVGYGDNDFLVGNEEFQMNFFFYLTFIAVLDRVDDGFFYCHLNSKQVHPRPTGRTQSRH